MVYIAFHGSVLAHAPTVRRTVAASRADLCDVDCAAVERGATRLLRCVRLLGARLVSAMLGALLLARLFQGARCREEVRTDIYIYSIILLVKLFLNVYIFYDS